MNVGKAPAPKHVLLTGSPGVGKTTLIKALAEKLSRYQPAGFYTEEIRELGMRRGFKLVTLDGRTHVLAHVSYAGPARVGRYGVDLAGFESTLMALGLCGSPARLIIIDEIGKMECLSRKFVEEVTALLDSPRIVLATVALRGEGFIQDVKNRPDCQVVGMTKENRDRLSDLLSARIAASLDKWQK